VNLGFGIVEADAEKALAMVFDLHELAVGGGLREAESRAVVEPRMPGDDAVGFAGTDDDGG
jgi:hypothetical protein